MKGKVLTKFIVRITFSFQSHEHFFFSVQYPTCVIEFTRRTTLDTNIENGIFFITHDGSQTKWKPSSLAKVKSDINLVSPAQAPDINRRLQSQTESPFHKELFELLRWGGRHSPVTREWINLETFRHQLNSHQTAWTFSKDSKREIWPRERRSLTNGWVNIIYNYSIFVQRISIQKHQVPNKIDNFILHNYGKQYLFLWNIFGKLFNEDGMNKFDI